MQLRKQFCASVLPSMLAQLLNSCFIIVDGFFIGQNMGDVGLAAINVAWPITALFQALSLCIGVGAAVRIATARGQNQMQEVAQVRGNAISLLTLTALVCSVVLYHASPVLLPFMGANEEIYPMALEYIQVVCALAVGQMVSTGLLAVLRSMGSAVAAMAITVAGLFSNILMDWWMIDVKQWGLAGAALATAVSQIGCAVVCLLLVVTHPSVKFSLSSLKMDKTTVERMLRFGIAPMGLSLSTSLIMLVTNLQAVRYGGTQGVAVYAVLSYVLGAVIPLITGVGDGTQPLLSFAKGAGQPQTVRTLCRWGLYLAVGAALLGGVVSWQGRYLLPALFGASEWAIAQGADCMWTLVLAYPFMAAAHFFSSYFTAVSQPIASGILSYGEPLVAQPFWLLVAPLFWHLEGVWIAYPAAVITMALVAAVLYYKSEKQGVE